MENNFGTTFGIDRADDKPHQTMALLLVQTHVKPKASRHGRQNKIPKHFYDQGTTKYDQGTTKYDPRSYLESDAIQVKLRSCHQ
jgi:hypothetical protein